MKSAELFLEAKKPELNLKPTVVNKIYEYISQNDHANSHRDGREFKKFLAAYTGDFPALAFDYSKCETKKEFLEDVIGTYSSMYEIRGNVLSCSPSCSWPHNNLWIAHIDTIGIPPFKIGTGFKDITIVGHKKIKRTPDFLPESAERLKIEAHNLESVQGISKIVKECQYITIYTRKIEQLKILELFEIKGIKGINFGSGGIYPTDLTSLIYGIFEEYKNKPLDVFDIQERLIDGGFENNAKR